MFVPKIIIVIIAIFLSILQMENNDRIFMQYHRRGECGIKELMNFTMCSGGPHQ